MKAAKIAISVLSDGLDNLGSYFGPNKTVHVWVLGGKTKDIINLPSRLPAGFIVGQAGTKLDEAVDQVRDELINIDQQLLTPDLNPLAWFASSLSDRGLYIGHLQVNSARFLMMMDIVKDGKNHVFLAPDAQTASIMYETCCANGFRPFFKRPVTEKPFHTVKKSIRARLSAVKTHIKHAWLTRKARKSTSEDVWQKLRECDVLLFDWVGEHSFHRDHLTDNIGNMKRMAGLLRERGLKVGFIAHPLSWTERYEKIAENVVHAKDPVVLLEECKSVGGVIKSCFATWQLSRRVRQSLEIAGYDLSPVLRLEHKTDLMKPQASQAYSYREIGRILAAKQISPKAVFYTYENQPWERLFCAGMKEALAQTKCIGYQHAPFPHRNIGFFPSVKAMNMSVVPDRLVVMGSLFKKWFEECGLPSEKIVIGGGLRFEGLTYSKKDDVADHRKTVVCCASMAFDESLDLVVKTSKAVATMPDVRLIVNYHHIVDEGFKSGLREALEREFSGDQNRYELSPQKALDLFEKADVIVYNSTGVAIEAMIWGVPVINVSVDGDLNYDKLGGASSACVSTYEELASALKDEFNKDHPKESTYDPTLNGLVDPVDEKVIYDTVFHA